MTYIPLNQIPPVGTKVNLHFLDIFGNPSQVIATIKSSPEHFGYYNKSSWFRSKSDDDIEGVNCYPCYRFAVHLKYKKHDRYIQTDNLKRIEIRN